MVCLEKMLNFDDFTSLNFFYILGTGIRLLLISDFDVISAVIFEIAHRSEIHSSKSISEMTG